MKTVKTGSEPVVETTIKLDKDYPIVKWLEENAVEVPCLGGFIPRNSIITESTTTFPNGEKVFEISWRKEK
jgi:hypothetical protein